MIYLLVLLICSVLPVHLFADINQVFIKASETANPKTLSRLLEQGSDINYINPETGYSALMTAIEEGNEAGSLFLIDRNADLEPILAKTTPLILASHFGQTKIVRKILSYSINICSRDSFGTALHHASLYGYLPIVTMLLDRDANIESKNKDGDTALILAAYGGYDKLLKYLITKGANISVVNNAQETALLGAVRRNNKNIINTLLQEGASITHTNVQGINSLMMAAKFGEPDILKSILQYSPPLEERNQFGNTALLLAVKQHQATNIKILIEAGANPNAVDKYGMTSLLIAAKENQIHLAKVLMKSSLLNTEIKDSQGKTALDYAEKYRNHELIKLILEYKKHHKKTAP
ncbi:MAG: ankyrin repeat domain-containing protein [Brevinemataceae bacterium]